ncbi:MAG: ATP-grasp domain-containing protein, partial [Thermodesulfobacteriota bacterium]
SSLTVLSHFQALGIPVVSPLESIRIARNKFLTLQALAHKGIRVPETCFVNSRAGYLAGVERLGGYPLVMKALNGRQGSEVFLIEREDKAGALLAEKLDSGQGLLLQRFIPPKGRRDFRVLVVGGEAVGAMELAAPAGDFRANFHVSNQARAARPSEAVRETALESARALGLTLAGIDLILDHRGGLFVIEVNYSPGFKGLEASTGLNVAGRIIDHAVSFMK